MATCQIKIKGQIHSTRKLELVLALDHNMFSVIFPKQRLVPLLSHAVMLGSSEFVFFFVIKIFDCQAAASTLTDFPSHTFHLPCPVLVVVVIRFVMSETKKYVEKYEVISRTENRTEDLFSYYTSCQLDA